MKFIEYLKDKLPLLLLHFICMFFLISFLRLTGFPTDNCVIILVCWLIILNSWMLQQFFFRRRYFRQMQNIIEKLDQRYLLGELMPHSFCLEDKLYKELIRKSNKSVIEHIHRIEQEQKDYREYIESWVHEIKAPITAITLNCENHKDERSRLLLIENQKVENYIDMALYYARSDEVYKDYMITETDLQKVAEKVLMRNKYYLIQNQIQANILCTELVFTDEKWISFILNQIIQNSVKYRKESNPCIHIVTERHGKNILLKIKDNGIGISKAELPRVFEKGFTGTNGRNVEHATGMGLYLCRKLCEKLGITIHADSELGKGTEIILEFPISSYLSDYRA